MDRTNQFKLAFVDEFVNLFVMNRSTPADSLQERSLTLRELGEFGLIQRVASRFALPCDAGGKGIGDDCAVLPFGENRVQLVTTDLLIQGRHFLLDHIPPEALGYKALAVNLSDIAAMGGVPTGAFLSMGVPADCRVAWLDAFFDGVQQLADETDCRLLGGDTTRAHRDMLINFTVIGEMSPDQVKYRAAAQCGDVLAVTGPLGDSGAGLRLLLDGVKQEQDVQRVLVERHHRPRPHLAEGQWLATRAEVHAMMDVSDGIDSDLHRIMEQAAVGACIHLDQLPRSRELSEVAAHCGWDADTLATCGGEDYVLLCAIDPATYADTARAFAQRFDRPLSAIGVLHDQSGVLRYLRAGKPARVGARGFDHFRSGEECA